MSFFRVEGCRGGKVGVDRRILVSVFEVFGVEWWGVNV